MQNKQQKQISKLEENIFILRSHIATWKQDKTLFGGISKIARENISRAESQLERRQQELEGLKQHLLSVSPAENNADSQPIKKQTMEKSADYLSLSPGEDFVYSNNELHSFSAVDLEEEQQQEEIQKLPDSEKYAYEKELEELKDILQADIKKFKSQWKKTRKEFIEFQEDKRRLEISIKRFENKLQQEKQLQKEKLKLKSEYQLKVKKS